MTKLAVLSVAALVLGGILGGCTGDDNTTTTTPVTSTDSSTTPVVFSNDKGEAMCPVMGAPMASTEGLQFQDYEGKRYYFCCADCPDKFAAEPEKYAEGKAMPADSTM